MNCNFCDGEMEFKEDSEVFIPVGNPKRLKIKASFFKCPDCGKELFKPDESMRVAKLVDNINDKLDNGEKLETVEISEGKIIF